MPFIRRTPAPAAEGVRPSPSGQRLLTSGIGSLDDILGGGLPVSTSLLLLSPDTHTQWSRLVARHIATAALLDNQDVVVLGPKSWADGLPWLDPRAEGSESEGEAESNTGRQREENIAWRYDQMGRFRTTVGSSRIAANTTIPQSTRTDLEAEGRLTYVDPGDSLPSLLSALSSIDISKPTRIILPDLGGLDLPLSPVEIQRALYTLRYVLRTVPAVAVITLPAKYDQPSHLADAVLSLTGFGGSPGLARAYYPSHGLITPHVLYNGHHLLAPALRYSQLLGVASGAGEQNLGFRLKRKRWVVESVHLGIEGGSSERRTEPVVRREGDKERTVGGVSEGIERVEGIERAEPAKVHFGDVDHSTAKDHSVSHAKSKPKPRARFADDVEDHSPSAKDHTVGHARHARFAEDVEDHAATAKDHSVTHLAVHHVHFDGADHASAQDHTKHGHPHAHFGNVADPPPSAKGHARVEIQHDRPDLYEF